MCECLIYYADIIKEEVRSAWKDSKMSFEPVPDRITGEGKKHYLGIQACFWSHIDRTESKTDYQIFPRLLALAERAWSDKSVTDYENFYKRELKHEFWLKYFDVKY